MKPILLFSFLLIIPIIVTAQYIPFPDSNTKWSMSRDTWDDPEETPFVDTKHGYVHEMSGDTLIDGLIYQKIFQRFTWWTKNTSAYELDDGTYIPGEFLSGNIQATPFLIGALRQDTMAQKVYFRRLSPSYTDIICIEPITESTLPFNEDILLFDFDMVTGDTIFLGGDDKMLIIENTDSVQYNDGIYRKRYFPLNSYPEFEFIEGIGATTGLFAGIRGEFVEGEWCNLQCFSNEGEYIIGTSVYNCDSIDVVSPVVNIDQNTKFNIYPNPFDQFLQIDFQTVHTGNFQLQIYNSIGHLILNHSISSQESFELDTQQFSKGIYHLSFYKEAKLLGSQKLVKF